MNPWNPLEELDEEAQSLVRVFSGELAKLNKRVNVISPTTIPFMEERHILHSLAIARKSFPAGSVVVDFGAGGGFPSIPLAIRFPDVQFIAVDSVRKKTEATRLFASRLGLRNLDCWNGRAEDWNGAADYAVSRATAPLATLWSWFERVQTPYADTSAENWSQGLITLKGGELADERAELLQRYPDLAIDAVELERLLGRPYFREKQLLHIHLIE